MFKIENSHLQKNTYKLSHFSSTLPTTHSKKKLKLFHKPVISVKNELFFLNRFHGYSKEFCKNVYSVLS